MDFLARGGSQRVSIDPVWSSHRPVTAGPDLRVRPAGVPAAGTLARPATSAGAAHASTSDALAALYEAQKGPRETRIPGYTGYIAGSALVAGRSQSRATSRALAHGSAELVWRDALPADPHNKDSLVRVQAAHTAAVYGRDLSTTLIGRGLGSNGHVSGYTGHVAGLKDCELGKSFGHITRAAGHTQLNPKLGRSALLATSKSSAPFPHNRSPYGPGSPHPKPVFVLEGTNVPMQTPFSFTASQPASSL